MLALISDYLSGNYQAFIFIYRESLKVANAIKILDFYILKLKRSHCARTDYIVCKASKLQHIL